MSTLSVATWGNLPNRSPACIATMGYLCGEAVEQPELPVIPGTGGSGGGYAAKRTYEEGPDYEKLKRERLIAQAREEDEIAVAVITMLLTTEFFE